MTQEVKNFSSGVLTNGGLVQKEQEREAKRQQEKFRKEAEEKSAAEAVARRIKAREERALEKAEQEAQAKAKQLADEERRRKADEKSAQDEVARLQVVAAKEAARLERQKDLERRLAEKAALQQQEEAKRKTQQKSAALLDSLSKEPEAEEGEPTQEQEAEEESTEPVFAPVKGEVLIPAEMPSLTSNLEPEPIAARDISELLPPPVVLTVEAEPQTPIQVESGKELIERVLSSTEEAPKEQIEETAQPNRSENRFQKMANTNRDLAKENDALKSKVEDLLDKLHSYEIEGELVGSMMDSVDRNKKEKWHEKPGQSYLNKDHFSVVKEAKQEMLKYLSTRQGEIDHCYKSELFAKYMEDPFYMNVFVQNHGVFEWWPVIDSIYNSIGLPKPDWSKVKVTSHAPQPIRARTATLGAPVASSEQPMDRIAQHLGNMGI
ncbi:hypothetical protein A9235_07295 [Polynucleobacter sp. MWH-Tro8-2-5-gr]|uniref:hypothetical protein n=1 Tax=Polynucleobacter sp. MWH-Tro8-2-5-gr TaxID=1855606 RepID=UPI0008F81840|nr:hypothetical protein [Polynucleobacter sp. MWH-Tro8-2-5-gr]OIM98668.1 hypothetical protein A9235_07295 [Polynucleobacter sp. MWH-Tro8-2-5-gr]